MARKKDKYESIYPPVLGPGKPISGVTVSRCGVSSDTEEGRKEINRALTLLFGEDEIVARSLEQNDCLHKWCREISNHLKANGANVTEETVKELALNNLGNVKEIEVPGMGKTKIAMRSHRYKATDSELTEPEKRMGFISMNELLSKVEAWAATDLNLNLVRDEHGAN